MKINNLLLTAIVFPLGALAGFISHSALNGAPENTRDPVSQSLSYVEPQHQVEALDCEPSSMASYSDDDTQNDVDEYAYDDGDSYDQGLSGLNAEEFAEQLDQALELESRDERSIRIGELLIQWASEDLDAAYDWLSSQVYGEEMDQFYYRLGSMYIETDIAAAGDVISALPYSDSKRSLVDEYVYKLAETDPNDALNWSNSIYDDELRTNAQEQAVRVWVEKNPREALDYVSISPDISDEFKEEMVAQAAGQLSGSDPQLASGSISQYPEDIRPQIAYGIASRWAEQDADGARAWVQSLQRGPTKDKAIQSYIDFASGEGAGDVRFNLAGSINDESTRIALMSTVFEQWHYEHPSEAEEALLSSSQLNDEQKKMLLGKARLN